MKVLFVSGFIPYPPAAGHLQRNYNLLRELSTECTIDLMTFTQRALVDNRDTIEVYSAKLREVCRTVKVFDIPADHNKLLWYSYLALNLMSTTPFTVWKFCSGQMKAEVTAALNSGQYDIVHFDSSDVAQYSGLVRQARTVLNHHNVESSLLARRGSNESNPIASWYLRRQARKLENYERRILPGFSMNLCVSEGDLDELRKLSPEGHFSIISNGTDIQYFTPSDDPPERRLVFAGPMNWYPNRDAMSYFCRDVYPLLARVDPELQVDIIGKSPTNELLALAERNPAIHVHGFVDDVRPLIARASVYIVPIRVGGGSRLKILDAMACGKAVVSTSVGCEGLEVANGKNLLIADEPQSFAESIERVLDDELLRKRLETEGRRLVETTYSWRSIGMTLIETYKSIL